MPAPGRNRLLLSGRAPLLDRLISFWSLEEASGTRLDAHGTNSLTDNNTVTQAVGKVGNAAQFTKANSESLSRPSSAAFQFGNTDWTIAAWVKPDTLEANQTVVAKGDAFSANEYRLRLTNAVANFEVFGAGGASVGVASVSAIMVATAWHFLVGWVDTVANTVNLQVNGDTPVSTTLTGPPVTSASSFAIGAMGSFFYFNGCIDQVSPWARKLTAGERTWLWNGGSGRSYASLRAYRG